VSQHKKGDGTSAYPNLLALARRVFILPHSSAAVERVFSATNLNKTKTRNRLEHNTLSGLLRTKGLLKTTNTECHSIAITNRLEKKHSEDICI